MLLFFFLAIVHLNNYLYFRSQRLDYSFLYSILSTYAQHQTFSPHSKYDIDDLIVGGSRFP